MVIRCQLLSPPECPEHVSAGLVVQYRSLSPSLTCGSGGSVLQDTFTIEHGVRYGHTVVSTEDQQHSSGSDPGGRSS